MIKSIKLTSSGAYRLLESQGPLAIYTVVVEMYLTIIMLLPILAATFELACWPNNTEHHRVRRIVGGVAPNYPPFDDPVVYVRFNGRSARVQGLREYPHYVFKGLKYAQPPIGVDRFLVSFLFFFGKLVDVYHKFDFKSAREKSF